LHKASENLATGLQQRVPHHNLQEALQTFSSVLDHIV
jgi:hypothetical protein